jgi:hypothetical protein
MSGSIYGTGLKGKATKLHAELVRSRGYCQSCGKTSNLQCCHIVTRERNRTRVDPANAFCLCAGCHLKYTHDPLEWVDFVCSQIGRDAYDDLQFRSKQPVKANDAYWQSWIDQLEVTA